MLGKIYTQQIFIQITEWFHNTREDGGDPAHTLHDMNSEFLTILKLRGLNLAVSEPVFRKAICAALCAIKRFGPDWSGPHRAFPYPDEWNGELELIWQSWLGSRLFTPTFWKNFWVRLPVSEWEADVDGWRSEMEHILPQYVCRTMDLFVREGLFTEDEDGGFVETGYEEEY
jgi:hypothetical protein